MFLNIITPCSRPQNLLTIRDSINIPRESYRWIVVFDFPIIPDHSLVPIECEPYCYTQRDSIVGHAQRNYALDIIDKGHIYFNDDDTTIHPELWDNIKDCSDNDFISFQQCHKKGEMRLQGDSIAVGLIDSHNFIVGHELAKNFRFVVNKYEADGIFATECFGQAKNRLYIAKPLSIYNLLRD